MHPVDNLLSWLPPFDFAVLDHGFEPHGRDYFLVVQDTLGGDPGTHRLVFTHVVHLDYETGVSDDAWRRSLGDELTDYGAWQEAGEPDGYVWGTNWTNAYPGVSVLRSSELADDWGRRLGLEMFEMGLETDRFKLCLVFHSIRHTKLGDDIGTIGKVIVPRSG